MKKLIMLALLASSINVFGQVPSYISTVGLKAYYPFNGNANDESGNGNNGTITGATLSVDRFANPNKAYSFNGTNAFINTNFKSGFGNSISLVAWMKTNQSTPAGIVCSRSGPGMLNGLESNGIDVGLDLTDSTNIPYQTYTTGTNYSDNNWHFIVGTFDGITSKIYVDGVLKKSNTFSINIRVGANFKIGVDDMYNRYFNGLLDDICIYNRALTASEITTLYTGCTFSNGSINPSGSTTFCQGGNVSLNCSAIGTPYTYQWKLNNSIITGATNSSYIANQSGSYVVLVDSNGCKSTSQSVIITVNPNPTVSINSLGNFINVNQAPITLIGNPVGGVFIGQGVSGNTFSPVTAKLGMKTVTYNYKDGNGCSNSASSSTNVFDTIGCLSYISIIDILKSDTTSKGIFIRQLQTDLENKDDTVYIASAITGDTLKISIHTSISATSQVFNSLKVFPNPASTILNIVLDNSGYFTATLTGITGQTIITSISVNKVSIIR
jgi:hypothetical protein